MPYSGRHFSEEEVQWIRDLIASSQGINRAAISARFCEHVQWRKPDGGLKAMSCRVALLKMHREGLIRLPPTQRPFNRASKHTERTFLTLPKAPIEKNAGDFELHCEVAERGAVRLWNEFIDRYHYLGYSSLAGAQIRYFVKEHDEILALLSFSAAAWKTAPRDRFIGWDASKRKKNLPLLVNNSRFLLLPWVRAHNLASRILALVCSRLPDDWQQRYGYWPLLAETFVDKERFAGTCYKAANWLCVGETQGRGKMDRYNDRDQPVKTIWLYPLDRRWKERLCA
ncbi:MAG: DUF4338 domain-containing protein [candidate division NC10 bacterium]|nr:DUF4338 domain-containing protein [candidate division NC10 bacterium]